MNFKASVKNTKACWKPPEARRKAWYLPPKRPTLPTPGFMVTGGHFAAGYHRKSDHALNSNVYILRWRSPVFAFGIS